VDALLGDGRGRYVSEVDMRNGGHDDDDDDLYLDHHGTNLFIYFIFYFILFIYLFLFIYFVYFFKLFIYLANSTSPFYLLYIQLCVLLLRLFLLVHIKINK